MRAGKAMTGGEQEVSFFANHINASGFTHLSIFWVGPRSPQFCFQDLGDSVENMYISLTCWGQNKAVGRSTDFSKTFLAWLAPDKVLLLPSLSHSSTPIHPNRSKLRVTCFSPKIPELEQIVCLYKEKMTLGLSC